MSKLFSRHQLIVVISISLISLLLSEWVAINLLKLGLMTTFPFSYAITFFVFLGAFQLNIFARQSQTRYSVMSITIAMLISLTVGEYFVYFLSEYGRMQGFIVIILASGVSLVYLGGFRLFFSFKIGQ